MVCYVQMSGINSTFRLVPQQWKYNFLRGSDLGSHQSIITTNIWNTISGGGQAKVRSCLCVRVLLESF